MQLFSVFSKLLPIVVAFVVARTPGSGEKSCCLWRVHGDGEHGAAAADAGHHRLYFLFHFRFGPFPFLRGMSPASFCDLCPILHSHISLRMVHPPEFPTMVLLTSLPVALLVALWGKSSKATPHFMERVEPAGQQ